MIPLRLLRILISILLCAALCGCFTLSQDSAYEGPPPRPPEIDAYYPIGKYLSFSEEIVRKLPRVITHRYHLQTTSGVIVVDYLDRIDATDDSLILVFPALGGKNVIENYFAEYIASHGFDTAVVHRNNEFKDPANVDRLEQLLRENVLRDRIALDFFENELGKHRFGTFGISRGGINVALTAGVDPRLKYNAIVLGGTNVVSIFRKTNQDRIKKYIRKVTDERKITTESFFEQLDAQIKTDPKNFAPYVDARNTLLILAVFDKTVPFQFGMKLREQLGGPETVFLMADHYSGLLFTGFGRLLPPGSPYSVLPLDYVETEAMAFYRKNMRDEKVAWSRLPYRILQFPFSMVAELFALL